MRGKTAGGAGAFGEGAAGGCLYPCRRVWRLHISDAALRGAACHEGVTGKKLIDDVIVPENTDYEFLGIKASPRQQEYRNKMEFSFGDAYKGGPLALGMHKRGSFYDIVDVPECRIVDDDFHTVLTVTLDYFKERNLPYYHKLRHTGYLRHLLVRKAVKTGEILVDLVTTTQIAEGGRGASCRMEGCVVCCRLSGNAHRCASHPQ